MLPRDQTQSIYPPAQPPGQAVPGPVRSDPSVGYGRYPPRGQQPFVGAFGHQPEHGGRQNVHDIPPTWDGTKPETQLEPYLKALRGWMLTTRTLKAQRGYVIVQYVQGELKQLLNYFDLDTLFSENGAEHCFNRILKHYQEFLKKQLPKVLDEALFDKDTYRRKQESFLSYTMRRQYQWDALEKQGWTIPDEPKAYLLR